MALGMEHDAHGVSSLVWAAFALMILVAKLGGEAAMRLKQPAVLGELLAGVILGMVPIPALVHVARGPEIGFAAELGVLLLLFQVGLESSVGEMVKVAPRAGLVAIIGVVVPSVLGIGASRLVQPDAAPAAHLFVGATLAATSVGITASVLKDLGVLRGLEAKVILGAAVIDDVLGLIVLAIVSAVAAQGSFPGAGELAKISFAAIGFVIGALVIGLFFARSAFRFAASLRSPHVLGAISIAFCLLLAGASASAGLAAIVGAYAAGLILDDVAVKPFGVRSVRPVEDFVSPIAAVFAPVFFVRTGMSVDVSNVGPSALLLTLLLVVCGVVGKLVAGYGVRGKELDRLMIGLGMTPRGEVGLIFADVASRLVIGGKPLVSAPVHAALVATVFVTTVIAPPALAVRIRSRQRRSALATSARRS